MFSMIDPGFPDVQDVAPFAVPAAAAMASFVQVVLIDIALAADNAIVVGALASGLPPVFRRRVILVGISAALVLRILFSLAATWLLRIPILTFLGGILLLWIAWKMWRDPARDGDGDGERTQAAAHRRFAGAAWAVVVADVSMSLDNVLAVAGVARAHPVVLVFGLVLSVALTGAAAEMLARLIERVRWLSYLAVAIIVLVAAKMLADGWWALAL